MHRGCSSHPQVPQRSNSNCCEGTAHDHRGMGRLIADAAEQKKKKKKKKKKERESERALRGHAGCGRARPSVHNCCTAAARKNKKHHPHGEEQTAREDAWNRKQERANRNSSSGGREPLQSQLLHLWWQRAAGSRQWEVEG